MLQDESLKQHKEEVALLLRTLLELRQGRKEMFNLALMKRWAHSLETETLAPVLRDEMYQVYRELSRMVKASRFNDSEIGIVHSILTRCGQYDEFEKL